MTNRSFGGLRLYRKARKLFRNKYDNEGFWQGKFGKGYYDMYTKKPYYKDLMINHEKGLVKFLKTIEFGSVLEFGAGFGRITKVISENFNVDTYDAFDISSDQIQNAKKHCKGLPVNFIVSSFNDFKSDKKYDVVIGCECLIHIPPEKLEEYISKMLTYSKKYFIITGLPYKPNAEELFDTPNGHVNTWYHDYDKIFKSHNLSIQKIPTNDETEDNEITICTKN
jgi:SAM-dependent methyltransferase